MKISDHFKASFLLVQLKEEWPELCSVNLNAEYGFSFYMGKAVNLDHIETCLWKGSYQTLDSFIRDVRLPFIQHICFRPAYRVYHRMFVALDLINRRFNIKYFHGFERSRFILQMIQDSAPSEIFVFIKYNPSFHGEYDGIGWTDIVFKLEQQEYDSITSVAMDIYRIGNDYLTLLPAPNTYVSSLAKVLQGAFKNAESRIWFHDEHRYLQDLDFPVPQKTAEWFMREEQYEDAQFAKWLSDYGQSFAVTLNMDDFKKHQLEERNRMIKFATEWRAKNGEHLGKGGQIKMEKDYAKMIDRENRALRLAGCNRKIMPDNIPDMNDILNEYDLYINKVRKRARQEKEAWSVRNEVHGKCMKNSYDDFLSYGNNL